MSLGVSGPSSGLYQFLSSLATSGTTPSRPVESATSAGANAPGENSPTDGSSPNGTAATTILQSPPDQLASLIQTTLNTLASNHTGNPLDALQSIEQSPGLGGLLGQFNVDPQQFRSDILSAMTQSPNGMPNVSL